MRGRPGWMGVFNPAITRDTTLRQNMLTVRYAQDAEAAAHRVLAAGMETLGRGLHAADPASCGVQPFAVAPHGNCLMRHPGRVSLKGV